MNSELWIHVVVVFYHFISNELQGSLGRGGGGGWVGILFLYLLVK